MKCRFFRLFHWLPALLCFLSYCGFVFAQTSSGPFNFDRPRREDVRPEQDLAASYYHYALAKGYENSGDAASALKEMQAALETNRDSSAIHYELAVLYARLGNTTEATRYANESSRLDSGNPDPHWLMVDISLRLQARRRASGMPAGTDGFRQALLELEILENLTPEDERVYQTLGSVYFDLGEVDKAIAAYEKYQEYSGGDAGYLEIARYFASVNDFETAVVYLNRGLSRYPDSVESLMTLGSIYLSQGKNSEGAEIYKRLFDVSSANAQIMRRLAAVLFDSKDYREAAGVLEKLAEKVRPDRVSQVLLGRCYFEMNRYSDAVAIFTEVLSRVSDDVEARFFLGEAYVRIGRFEDAAKMYKDLLQDRQSQEAFSNRAIFRERLAGVSVVLENYEEAIALYEEIVKTDPGDGYKLLEAYRFSERYDKGLALGKELLEKNPDDIRIGIIYARMLADAGKEKEGVKYLTSLLQSQPDNTDIYVNLSEIHRQERRYSDAEKVLLNGEARNKNPESAEQLKFLRAAVYERQKKYDQAERLFMEILEKRPDHAAVLNYLGYMLADRGVRLDEAIRNISKALENDPENGAYLDSLGWAYFKLGDMENAEKYLLEAAGIVLKDSTIFDHLGDLYYKLGQLEKARDYWTEAVRIGKDSEEESREVRRKLKQIEETLRRKK